MLRRQARDRLTASATWRPRLVIMVKEPVAGRVKTRLARSLGVGRATAVYRHMSGSVIGRLARSNQWQTVIAVAPGAKKFTRAWPDWLPRAAQGPGDLGAKMQAIMDWPTRGPIVIVGTDIPAIRQHDIANAFRALGSHDAVFGPAADGGYWLVGFRRRPRVPRAFSDVRWSTEFALADTLRNVPNLMVTHLRMLADVDTEDGLRAVAATYARRI